MYTFISIAVVVLTTFAIGLVFKRKGLNDLRYYLGLGCSAVTAIIASLFFPDIISFTAVDLGLQIVLAFFIAFLVYVTLLFLFLILVVSIFSKEKSDKLKTEWMKRKAEKEQKQRVREKEKEENKEKEKKEAQNREQKQKQEQEQKQEQKQEQEQEQEKEKEETENLKKDKTLLRQDSAAEPVLKNIFIRKFIADKEDLKPEDRAEERRETEDSENMDIFDEAALDMESLEENRRSEEKNVDMPDIIDKMGIGTQTNTQTPGLDMYSDETDTEVLLDDAFRLKQQGREMEAVSLYMTVLNRKPDNETVFWTVVDICAIYKGAGQAELAEDILKTYLQEYENLMSEEIKAQILQSLYM